MNQSLWITSSKGKSYEKLNKEIKTKCLIVGAGIVGITTGYLLSKRGIDVTIIDADYIAYGASGRNTGKLTPQHNVIYSKIKKKYGLEVAREYYNANIEAIDLIERVIIENNIECDFERVDSYIFSEKEENENVIREEFDVCKEIGIECEFTMEFPLPINTYGAIKFKNTAQFNPKKYINMLAEKIIENGANIYEKTVAVDLEISDVSTVKTADGYEIHAEKVIICSHFPFYDGLSFYFTRLKPERSYVVAGKYDDYFPEATFINIEKPSRSLRGYTNKDTGEKFLLIAGEKHKVAHNVDADRYDILKKYGKDIFGVEKFDYQWSTQDYITPDSMPYIGYLNSAENSILVATGFGKWGLSNGTAAAIILSTLYLDKEYKYESIFTPSRIEGYFSKEFISENIDVGVQYIVGKLKVGEKEMPNRGEGKIIRTDKGRYGAYRDNKDHLHIVDITCTHLGCELKWNSIEKSWDCPCHGSRFSIDGNILEGPATIPLNHYGQGKNIINPNIINDRELRY